MGTQHVIAVGLTQVLIDGRWAADRDSLSRGGDPDRSRPSAPPGDVV
ncbi:hypothetical protein ACH4TX_43290 [Streptomyces sp. NPDC021098]